eukprot:21216-Chlamydomonas_euryale.AAC.30
MPCHAMPCHAMSYKHKKTNLRHEQHPGSRHDGRMVVPHAPEVFNVAVHGVHVDHRYRGGNDADVQADAQRQQHGRSRRRSAGWVQTQAGLGASETMYKPRVPVRTCRTSNGPCGRPNGVSGRRLLAAGSDA